MASYRGATFMDPSGRGTAQGWDYQKVRHRGTRCMHPGHTVHPGLNSRSLSGTILADEWSSCRPSA